MINFNYLEQLPFKEPMRRSDVWYAYSYGDCHPVGGINTWKRIRRIIYNNIGKSFDMAFRYYCKQVPKYQQYLFLDEFDNNSSFYVFSYSIDSQGNICKPKRQYNIKSSYKVYSKDYKVKWIHKQFKWVTYIRPWNENEYERSYDGSVLEFKSRKDPLYKKLVWKQQAESKQNNRINKKLQKQKSLDIFNNALLKQKEKLLEQKALDILKRDQAGFDENSFKGENYHGRKKKKCKQQKKLLKSLKD